ncbi:peptide chain release factor N(5)-glutamine methyltransferase [Corticibacter populi]|uniref:Release factor glutamine methyltransferase n=1 Tax=Corticibacter populi TaxID=1550736 RepID=A0A3M6QXL7_9BURK|nr:peptide chain release factor N(5)-glutamine methyltransferase [Corticibacter populi]RMX07651.1 peptide chain release factor N(5)-glutamine methyltransferase [Corticibacter populi]
MPTIAQALRQAQAEGLDRLDAQLLLLHALGQPRQSRAWLLSHDECALDQAEQALYQQLCTQRRDGVPLAYLVGEREFFGLPLQVGPAVLDPRPDTETLVEWALDTLRLLPATARVLDLGTGSGAIALAIQSQRPDAQVWASDASAAALAQARANGGALGLPVHWLEGSWFEPVAAAGLAAFDLIVSNPPYIAEDDPHLAALRHEPISALSSGPDGLRDLHHIIATAPAYLRPGGHLLLEHGWQQHAAVADYLNQYGYVDVGGRRDLAGHWRCTGGRRP